MKVRERTEQVRHKIQRSISTSSERLPGWTQTERYRISATNKVWGQSVTTVFSVACMAVSSYQATLEKHPHIDAIYKGPHAYFWTQERDGNYASIAANPCTEYRTRHRSSHRARRLEMRVFLTRDLRDLEERVTLPYQVSGQESKEKWREAMGSNSYSTARVSKRRRE